MDPLVPNIAAYEANLLVDPLTVNNSVAAVGGADPRQPIWVGPHEASRSRVDRRGSGARGACRSVGADRDMPHERQLARQTQLLAAHDETSAPDDVPIAHRVS